MYIGLIISFVATFFCADHAWPGMIDGATLRTLGVFACLVSSPLFAMLAIRPIVRAIVTDDGILKGTCGAAFRRVRQIHLAIYLASVGFALGLFGWAQLVRVEWQLDRMLLIDELLLLVPVVVPVVISWALFWRVESVAATYREQAGLDSVAVPPRHVYVFLQARHYLGLLLVPVLIIVAAEDTVQIVAPNALEGPHAWLVHMVPLGILLTLFPAIIRLIWRTERLADGPLRDRLELLAKTAKLRLRDILVWRTEGTVANAAVAGIIPRLRYVLLTDALLEQLSDEQIEAVFAHEMGHVRRHHLLLRVLAVVAPIALWVGIDSVFVEAWPPFIVPIVIVGCLLIVLAWYCRLLEHQADLWACRTIGDGSGRLARKSVESLCRALISLSSPTEAARAKRTWLHPSIDRRVGLLCDYCDDDSARQQFERRLTYLSVALALGMPMVALLFLF